jgi:hypothetical protein
MEKPWKVILAFIGVFAAGAIFGGLFTIGIGRKVKAEVGTAQPAPTQVVQTQQQPPRKPGKETGEASATPPPRGLQPALMRQLTQRLSPTQEQKKAIGQIVARAADDWQRLGREHIADVARVMDRMYEDVSALLSPEQRTQLEKMRQETLEKARQERLKRMAPVEPPLEGANRSGGIGRPAPKDSNPQPR